MQNQNNSKGDLPPRNIVERILNPTQQDEPLVRIFFWISILSCIFLPRVFEDLSNNRAWNIFSTAWIILAVYVRAKIFFVAQRNRKP